ncbi:MAG TPA: hypothetical protein PLX69_22255 [Leptospiraceae bacterium]|nr:hypothetical protein [Leptospiraceae bacterium]HRG77298.1 hypothetical protein [Leptospiraceae bacterium]
MKNKFFAFKSKFKENRFPVYVIANQDPRVEKEWEHSSYEKVFIGLFETYKEALLSIQELESNFSEWEEVDDSYLQGETVFVRS